MQDTINIYFDGASRGNPGPAGCGWVIQLPTSKESTSKEPTSKEPDTSGYCYHGDYNTNNEAEYTALLKALEDLEAVLIMSTTTAKNILIMGDSKLVIEQVSCRWKLNAVNLKPIFDNIQRKLASLRKEGYKIDIKWIPREMNGLADKLSNTAIDTYVKKDA